MDISLSLPTKPAESNCRGGMLFFGLKAFNRRFGLDLRFRRLVVLNCRLRRDLRDDGDVAEVETVAVVCLVIPVKTED